MVVSRLFVTGSVQPAASKVVVACRFAPNHGGRFGLWLPLRRGVTHIRISRRASGYVADTTEVAVRSTPPSQARKRQAAQQLVPSIARLRLTAWTPAVKARSINACVVSGGWQSYCECALRYEMAAGSPLGVASSVLAARSRRRLSYWLEQTIINFL